MLSIFCIQLLREVCRNISNLQPDLILSELDIKFKEYLLNGISENEEVLMKDGMDVAIATVNKRNKKLQYSAASSPFVMIKNGDLQYIKGSRYPIGSHRSYKKKNFEPCEFDFNEGDRFYLSSDDYPDQFGGSNGKKLRSNRFKELLLESSTVPLEHQKQLDKVLREWQGDYPQIDDILLIGIEL